jgi:hypothetical protein
MRSKDEIGKASSLVDLPLIAVQSMLRVRQGSFVAGRSCSTAALCSRKKRRTAGD